MRYVGRQNLIMPTTCAVVGCHNRQSKYSKSSFYRFPKEEERRRRWIAFVSRKNSDGSAWEPGNGDRICSQHFINGKKSDLYINPNYVPSIQAKNSPDTECNAALSRFERASNRAKLQMERRRQEERIALEVQRVDEEREKMIRSTVRAFNNDHTYTRKSFIEDTSSQSREEPLECTSVELPIIDNIVVLQPTLSQPEHAFTDCCIPVETGMATCLAI